MGGVEASFGGEIPEIPGIAVDNFNNRNKRAYFLSHCHADHVSGLSTLKSRNKNPAFIYMSEVSAAIVETHFDYNLKEFIIPLKGTNTIKLPADEENGYEETYIEVTVIPAGHCFGSVMFLFKTNLKTVLFTGDFRISENTISKMGQLHANNKPIKLDALYVDTTFLDEKFDNFPKRSDIMVGVLREIKKWMALGDDYRVGLVTSARYGYEFIFKQIYNEMNTNVYVSGNSNWDLYERFREVLPGVTNDRSRTKIHLCSKIKKYCNICENCEDKKTLYIKFSALKWKHYNPDIQHITTESINSRSVCFATHCSRSELIHFIEYLNPMKIVGFPEDYVKSSVALDSGVKTPVKRQKTPQKKDSPNKKPKKVPEDVLRGLFG